MNKAPLISPWFRLLICILIIAVSLVAFTGMNKLKKPLVNKQPDKQIPTVEVIKVKPERYQHIIDALGEISSKKETVLSAEVQGEVIKKSQHAEAGDSVQQGELLFLVDPREYKINLQTSLEREKILNRDLQIAESELKRMQNLYKNKKIVSLTNLEQAESKVNSIKNQLAQTRQQAEIARIKLEKCRINAPFNGRIKEVKAETGTMVTPGQKLITLVDDQNLEITVPVKGSDAVDWLRFKKDVTAKEEDWHNTVYPAKSHIIWSEKQNVKGTGIVKRVVNYDSSSRMFNIMIDITENSAKPIPLSEGMFCKVEIEGKELQNVFIIPRSCVQNNQVMVVENSRLKIRPVKVIQQNDKQAVILQGLNSNDEVVITRINNPVENKPVRVITNK